MDLIGPLAILVILLSTLGWMTGRTLGMNVHPLWLVRWLLRQFRLFVAGTLRWIAQQINPSRRR